MKLHISMYVYTITPLEGINNTYNNIYFYQKI